jgi:hypothetical protein
MKAMRKEGGSRRVSMKPRDVLGVLLLAGIVALFFLRAVEGGGGMGLLVSAAESRNEIRTDEAFHRVLLGRDYAIAARLRAAYPAGVPVSTPIAGDQGGALQRLWLTLLPEYPISSKADLAVVPLSSLPRGIKPIVRGEGLALVWRNEVGRVRP